MKNLKSLILFLVIILVLGLLAFWSVKSLQSGTEHRTSEIIEGLQIENEELKNQVTMLERELDLLRPAEEEVVEEVEEPAEPSVYKHQTLISKVEQLISDNVSMKLKSRGTRVGTVQEFLNLYNGTSKKVDNDYGNGTKTDIISFQKSEGLTADGEAGPATFRKMVEWLKAQG